MRIRGEHAQTVVAGMISTGILLLLSGRYYCFIVGFFLLVGGFLAGLLYIFSARYLGRRSIERVTVEARFVDNDGEQEFDVDPPPEVDCPRYLRLVMPDQTLVEVRCDPYTYDKCTEGSVGLADIRGEHLFSFRKLS